MALPKFGIAVIGGTGLIGLAIFALPLISNTRAAASSVLSKTYTNSTYGFSLKMPEDFSAYPPEGAALRDDASAATGQAIVLQNSTGKFIQIVITADPRESASDSISADDLQQL